jgi:Flp pilus assembly protein TadG
MAEPARKSERGASTIELAVLTPVLLLVILLTIQFTLIFHARHVALAAAQAGDVVARGQLGGDWQAAAESAAGSYAAKVGGGVLTGTTFVANGDGDNRWVIVKGKAQTIIPLLPDLWVTEKVEGPIECFRPDIGNGTSCGQP